MNKTYSIRDYFIDPIILKLNNEELELREKIMKQIISSDKPYVSKNSAEKELLISMSNKNTVALVDNEVRGIYPVSATKTNKKVIFDDGSYSYAMCAIDAIGYHYAFNRKIRIESECQKSKDKLILSLDKGVINIIQGPKDIHVLHTDLQNNDDWSSSCCNIMHFFYSENDLDKWKNENNIMSKVFSLDLETANKIAWLLFSK